LSFLFLKEYNFTYFFSSIFSSDSSLAALLNSLIPPPKPFNNSGIFYPPNINKTKTTIIAICHGPIIPKYIDKLIMSS
jgi:hypothetical protein